MQEAGGGPTRCAARSTAVRFHVLSARHRPEISINSVSPFVGHLAWPHFDDFSWLPGVEGRRPAVRNAGAGPPGRGAAESE